jgi:PKD repeat protein
MEGTSMAAAHVSAVAALLIANEVAVKPADVREALESTAEDKGPAGWDTKHGWGIVNASAALKWKPEPGPEPEPEPEPGPLPLAAKFKAEPTSGGRPLRVQFIDESTGNITSWLWDFGDGTTSNQQNPLHTYTDTCHYTVSLTVTSSKGSDTETKENYINAFVADTPVANFEGQPTDGEAPLSVQFTDLSTCRGYAGYCWEEGSSSSTSLFSMDVTSLGGITRWSWDFGDGEQSTKQNPVHTYKNSGTYTVNLRATGPGGWSNKSRYNYIHITAPPYPVPVADFVGIPRTGDDPLTVGILAMERRQPNKIRPIHTCTEKPVITQSA